MVSSYSNKEFSLFGTVLIISHITLDEGMIGNNTT